MKKILFLSMFFCSYSYATIDNFTKKLFDLTNPSGADQFSAAIDISAKGAYSVYCALTGTLTFVSTLQSSNQNDVKPALQTFTDVTGTTQTITNAGFMYDVTLSSVSSVRQKIGTFTGTGTAKCYLTAKDI